VNQTSYPDAEICTMDTKDLQSVPENILTQEKGSNRRMETITKWGTLQFVFFTEYY
jgi:hypothetical protein